jgi:hypothetical protein
MDCKYNRSWTLEDEETNQMQLSVSAAANPKETFLCGSNVYQFTLLIATGMTPVQFSLGLHQTLLLERYC